jgi:hypothetical protein
MWQRPKKEEREKKMAGITYKSKGRRSTRGKKGFPLYVTDWLTSQSHVIRKKKKVVVKRRKGEA